MGGWLFRHRTVLPLPVAIAILTLPAERASPRPELVASGIALTVTGELLRLWGVHHIGAVSRTRSERLGPLVDSGPFGLIRNPLYVGNVVMWVGFTLVARLVWLAPIVLVLLGAEYHAIVRWEERLLETRLGDAYRRYARQVPRWIPKVSGPQGGRVARDGGDVPAGARFSWTETLFSERGTLVAMAAGYALLWLKARS